MSDTELDFSAESSWSGGVSPYATNSKKLGMWLFLLSDSLTFSTAILAYAYVRLSSPNWPRPFEISPAVLNATVMTLVLLSSSLTMVMAVHAGHKGRRKSAVWWILATMSGGLLFDVLHLSEWFRLIFNEKVTPWSNPWGDPLFGGTFFGLTGLHMLHVTIGVIYLGIIAYGFGRGKYNADHVEVSGLYWHFVDLVWMFIFPMIYLMSVNLNS
ncbi:MAG TPA: cytochrome c oxidase subunit 3 [Candidatus Acidoferrales bacterium]|nr:cytochrome c oxidase subunit 3 [Candidatus Acidoferrales bacterium]